MRRRIHIIQGERAYAAQPGLVLSTLLGSCVAACLYDPVARVGGMNHFLLGEPVPGADMPSDRRESYGTHAMAMLIAGLVKRGAVRGRLCAFLFGGGDVVEGLGRIGRDNAAFARRFLATEGIELRRADLGGVLPRRVAFMPYEGWARSTPIAPLLADAPHWSATTATHHHVELL